MHLRCPRCGNDDPERMLTVTDPYQDDWTGLRGQILTGWRCASCGAALPDVPIGEPTEASAASAGGELR